MPLADLPIQAEEWEQAVTEMTAEDEEIAEYVQSLEERGDAEVDMTEALGKIDGDALAAEFERYLRRRGPRLPWLAAPELRRTTFSPQNRGNGCGEWLSASYRMV